MPKSDDFACFLNFQFSKCLPAKTRLNLFYFDCGESDNEFRDMFFEFNFQFAKSLKAKRGKNSSN